MNFDSLIQQVFSFAGTFDYRLVAALFVLCAIGEFGLSIPYFMETVWLIGGYQVGVNAFSVFQLALLLLAAQAGRQTGATMLYHLSRFGSLPLSKLYRKYREASLAGKMPFNGRTPFTVIKKINLLSPFSIALGRLLWLRVPLTITLGAKRKMSVLAGGVLLSSLVWDGVYISLGMITGTATVLKPAQMILYSLAGLTLLYLVMFAVKLIVRRRASQYQAHQA